jgi:hypothetical protein
LVVYEKNPRIIVPPSVTANLVYRRAVGDGWAATLKRSPTRWFTANFVYRRGDRWLAPLGLLGKRVLTEAQRHGADGWTIPAAGWFHLQDPFGADRFTTAAPKPGAAGFMIGMPNYPAIYAIRAALDYIVAG